MATDLSFFVKNLASKGLLQRHSLPLEQGDFFLFPKKTRPQDIASRQPVLLTVDLSQSLQVLVEKDLPEEIDENRCSSPILMYGSPYSVQDILIHYDGTLQSFSMIKRFVRNFYPQIAQSHATIISPNHIPKSKIREEQELLQLVAHAVDETSFIKFNFEKIEDFRQYSVKKGGTLLVSSKRNTIALFKLLLKEAQAELEASQISFYLD